MMHLQQTVYPVLRRYDELGVAQLEGTSWNLGAVGVAAPRLLIARSATQLEPGAARLKTVETAILRCLHKPLMPDSGMKQLS